MLTKNKKLWREIRRHGAGYQITVRVTGHRPVREQCPLTMSPAEMQARRKQIRAELHRTTPPAVAGTFAKDAANYLKARKAMPGIQERTRHIALWVKEFGERPRATIKPWEIAAVRDRWLTEGPRLVTIKGGTRERPRFEERKEPLSASQVNNRLRALENLWTMLDGRHAYNPVREVDEPEEPESGARGLPYDVVERIIGALRQSGKKGAKHASLTALRLSVIAYVGLSHGELGGITAKDLHLNESPPWVWVAGRGKGKGTKGTAQPLTERGAAALRGLAEAKALGRFSRSSMWKSVALACHKLGLSGIHPYDFRHSFASEVMEKTGGNLPVTQLLMRHKSQKTTRRYVERAIDPVRAAALEQVRKAGGFAPGNAPPPTSPDNSTS